MKFIMVHGEDLRKHWINPTTITSISEEKIKDAPSLHSYIWFPDSRGKLCIETPEEILQKIAEAEDERERKDGDTK